MTRPVPETSGGSDETKWVKFWETSGSLSAEVIAGRLRSEGIPAWVWQQGAGAAMGLIYGPMGRGHVMVPEDQLEDARQIMTDDLSDEAAGAEEWQEVDSETAATADDDGWLAKGILALTALAVSPLGVIVAFVVTKLFGKDEDGAAS